MHEIIQLVSLLSARYKIHARRDNVYAANRGWSRETDRKGSDEWMNQKKKSLKRWKKSSWFYVAKLSLLLAHTFAIFSFIASWLAIRVGRCEHNWDVGTQMHAISLAQFWASRRSCICVNENKMDREMWNIDQSRHRLRSVVVRNATKKRIKIL